MTQSTTMTVQAKDSKVVVAAFVRSAIQQLKAAASACSADLRGTERDLRDEIARLEDILGALENGS